jgi:hypothetical protein
MKSLLTILAIVISAAVYAQTPASLSFCMEVKDGRPVNEGSEFYIDKEGGLVTLFFKAKEAISLPSVNFKIYRVNDKGEEEYDATLTFALNKPEPFITKEVIFYDEATYIIRAFDPKGEVMARNSMKIKYYN